ncbi:hypothetical protein DFH06DRAFT_1129737 [Mycena polygramma]|nr:hypothetical protein DFH06DRAFT_1129737 [Mycena polygramma]
MRGWKGAWDEIGGRRHRRGSYEEKARRDAGFALRTRSSQRAVVAASVSVHCEEASLRGRRRKPRRHLGSQARRHEIARLRLRDIRRKKASQMKFEKEWKQEQAEQLQRRTVGSYRMGTRAQSHRRCPPRPQDASMYTASTTRPFSIWAASDPAGFYAAGVRCIVQSADWRDWSWGGRWRRRGRRRLGCVGRDRLLLVLAKGLLYSHR